MIKRLQFIIPLLFIASISLAQNVTGVVRDAQGEAIVGATVVVKSTKAFAVTDLQGQFSLTPPKEIPFTIVISSTGYKSQNIQVFELSDEPLEVSLVDDNVLSEVVVTSRRRNESVQDIPIPVSVVSGELLEDAGAFNVNRVKEVIPSVQLYTSNPRNTGINIRGLGSPFGLTNDGLDPGVGFYVDGVYYARPAAATLDFIDVDRIEVLRGPQGTLFGKNTTAGAFNITTRKPSFEPGANFEVSYGNYGYVQAKSSITGPLSKTLAARVSFSGTQRDGTIKNIANQQKVNDINNLGGRVQLLYKPSENTSFILSGDASRQRPVGYAQVVAGVVETKRPAYRQFNNIIKDLNYTLPSDNAFDRVIDHDTPWRSGNDLGGVSLTYDQKIGSGTLTSTTAWRYWNWDPSNDRDFTGLQALAKSQNPAEHKNWSQEVRYAGQFSPSLSGVIGVFAIGQDIKIHGTEESGNAQWRFSQSSTSNLWKTPGLFEGYGISTEASIKSLSAAAFANADWKVTEAFHVQPGVRFNYDKKEVSYDRTTYGGLQTTDPALLALKNGVYSSQFYEADADENNFTYLLTLAYKVNKRVNTYATYSTSFKPVGVNVAGLPTINNAAATDLAVIKPEDVKHIEFGAKTTPFENFTLNLTFFNTDIKNYQTNVQSPELGVNRGYIANAEKVNVKGAELDANFRISKNLTLYGAATYTDAKYVRFTNAPLPLEETGATVQDPNDPSKTVQLAFKDISGGELPGISKWAGSFGGEVLSNSLTFFGQESKLFFGFNAYYRSDFSSSPSPSAYLNIDGYALFNAQAGFRATTGLSFFVWGRNIFNKNYYEQLLVAGGNAGQYAGVLGDPRTYGVTIRYNY